MPHHRVVSLWDMLNIYAHGFVASTTYLSVLAGILAEKDQNFKLVPQVVETLNRELLNLREELANYEAPATLMAIDQSLKAIKNGMNPAGQAHCLTHVREALVAELNPKTMLLLTKWESELVDAKHPFGDDVANTFPDLCEDIEEASFCLAVGRYTASVFHLMRAMEGCVQAIAGQLAGIAKQKVWGHLLADIEQGIRAIPDRDERASWNRVHALLFAVKDAWRNDVMHPKQTYTGEQAKEVYEAMRSFMRALAPKIAIPGTH